MAEEDLDEIWKNDLLGFKERGIAFTNLVTSITDHRTISIEAGYGHGKTFFRERWARQLEAAGECVVQIDARLSDHSGDPVVTFLGALLGLVPEKQTKRRDAAFGMAKKIGIAGTKAIARAALREGFEEIADAVTGDGEASSLHDIAKSAGQDLSKAAGDMIATQLEAEKARLELGEQLKLLHEQITKGRDTDRIIIVIDELDRCHPDYAIALLEAMKLVFDQDGFVFVLMVNRDYLEGVAEKRFGKAPEGESYLDKFVDLRLKLETDRLSSAAQTLAAKLTLTIPFGEHEEFSVARAAELAGQLAPASGLSMRQIKRVLERVELACLIYAQRPIDPTLLIWLAFSVQSELSFDHFKKILPKRFDIRPSQTVNFGLVDVGRKARNLESWADQNKIRERLVFPELSGLNLAAFKSLSVHNYLHSAELLEYLATAYIPEHQDMLDAVHKLQADA